MHCKCCDAILPPITIYRTILAQHPTLLNETTEIIVMEDLCEDCVDSSSQGYVDVSDNLLADLGLQNSEILDYDRYY